MDINIRAIKEADLVTIMNWRMSESVTRYMNTDPILTLEGQLKWYRSLKNDNTKRYWMVEVDGKPAGIINLADIDWKNKSTSWGYYIGETELRSLKLAISMEMSLYDYCFNLLGLDIVHNETFKLNEGVWKLHLACGCSIDNEVKNEIEKNGFFYDVMHLSIKKEKWNEIRKNKKYIRLNFDLFNDSIGSMVPHHLGVAVADIDQAVNQYTGIGWQWDEKTVNDCKRNVNIAFLKSSTDSVMVELVSPAGEDSPVTKTLKTMKNVSSPYHICYEVEDLDMISNALKRRKYIMVSPPSPAVAFNNRRVAFLLNKDSGLIELLERE